MTRPDPTGRAYKDALADVQASDPAVAHAIAAHVDHLNRRYAKLELDRAALEQRVDQLAAAATTTSSTNTSLLILDSSESPDTMTSPEDIALAAMDLVGRLVSDDINPRALLLAEAVKLGPLACDVFLIALQGVAEGARAARWTGS